MALVDSFPGQEYYESEEYVDILCTYPGCMWRQPSYWDEDMHLPFVEHFQSEHPSVPSGDRSR